MTASNVAATQKVVDAFLTVTFPWLPLPKVVEWDNVAGGSTYYTGNAGATISVPKYSDAWNDGRADIDIHECGHVLAFYLASIGHDPLVEFLRAFGASDALLSDRSKLNEIFAEHFVRAYLPSYDGHNRQELVGLVPFDAAKMRALCERLKPTVPAGAVVAPPAITTPAGPTPWSSTIIDVRDELPRPVPYWEIGRFAPKNSRTYHWNGPAIPEDVHALDIILGEAHYHLTKDWSDAAGVQAGDGVMYHKFIARDGVLYITRDPDAVLYACGSALGNAQSEHVQVMCGTGQSPTAEQYRTMAWLERTDSRGDTYPHRIWSGTTCPGPDIGDWIGRRAWTQEDDMTDRATFNQWFKEEYETYGVATLFDRMKEIDKTLADQNTADNERDAQQQAALDQKSSKGHTHNATIALG